jgi:hypothetical protein
MTEDLITDLSKVSDLFVIARNSTLTYTSKTATIRQVAEKFPDRADILAPSSGCIPNKRCFGSPPEVRQTFKFSPLCGAVQN